MRRKLLGRPWNFSAERADKSLQLEVDRNEQIPTETQFAE
jgi:hypothetical protein